MIKQSPTVESIDTATQNIFWACRRRVCKTAWPSTAVSARGTQPVEEVHHETKAAARKRRTTCPRRPSRRLHALENASRLQDPFRSSSFSPSPNSTALSTARGGGGGGHYRLREEENTGWRRWDAILSSGFRLAAGTTSVWFRRWKQAAVALFRWLIPFFLGVLRLGTSSSGGRRSRRRWRYSTRGGFASATPQRCKSVVSLSSSSTLSCFLWLIISLP